MRSEQPGNLDKTQACSNKGTTGVKGPVRITASDENENANATGCFLQVSERTRSPPIDAIMMKTYILAPGFHFHFGERMKLGDIVADWTVPTKTLTSLTTPCLDKTPQHVIKHALGPSKAFLGTWFRLRIIVTPRPRQTGENWQYIGRVTDNVTGEDPTTEPLQPQASGFTKRDTVFAAVPTISSKKMLSIIRLNVTPET
ncbi:hypothetical protein BO78DRAFT_430847 [Aspergillus sclerotiicarbonarius CBS 121057]|uniref:Uncharacterized protein n=1 Tax=Aspergillus sclerotiicarbonarius (strain CBS 121057 / IBT 28362) TaxID=1448318 RepID=A0A319EN19_ASPSB|nr:hypothetical protein BO78DRAFT_430847 [Aspergillus sclerotiicarbonarius CBS 121057]